MASDPTPSLRLLAAFRDVHTENYFFEFCILTLEGASVSIVVPREVTAKPPNLQALLLKKGWAAPTGKGDAAAEISQALSTSPTLKVQAVTTKTGLHRDHFVLPHRTIGPDPNSIRFLPLENTDLLKPDRKGTLDGWSKGLSRPLRRSSYLTFSTSLSLAGALLQPFADAGAGGIPEGVIFQFTGMSNAGKTTALQVAVSTVGRSDGDLVLPHTFTDRGFEELLAASNNGLIALDDTSRIPGKPSAVREHIRTLPHVLASGQGKRRSGVVAASGLANLTYKVIGVSTGETPLESYGERLAGERVRFPDIPVPLREEGGILDRLKEGDSAADLVNQAKEAINANYGHAYEAFVSALLFDLPGNLKVAERHIREFVEAACDGTDPWDRRFAQKFGLVYAAGALGAAFGILPFSATHAKNCALRLHKKARIEARAPQEALNALLVRIRKAIGTRRLPEVGKGKGVLSEEAWGACITRERVAQILIPKSKLELLIQPARHVEEVIKLLVQQGLLIPAPKARNVHQIQLAATNGERRHYYVLDRAKIVQA